MHINNVYLLSSQLIFLARGSWGGHGEKAHINIYIYIYINVYIYIYIYKYVYLWDKV